MNKAFILSIITIFSLSACALWLADTSYHLKQAEELSRQGKFEEAILEYRQHMQVRLAIEKRPAWENPYLYLLMIGDIQLSQALVQEALLTFELAEKNKVDTSLISDRYRAVAAWYEKHEQLDSAIEVLKKYRDRDPLLFDSMLDRLAKEAVRRENSASRPSSAKPTPAASAASDRPKKSP